MKIIYIYLIIYLEKYYRLILKFIIIYILYFIDNIRKSLFRIFYSNSYGHNSNEENGQNLVSELNWSIADK